MNNTVPVSNSSSGSVPSEYPAPISKNLSLPIVLVLAAEFLIGFPKNLQVCFILYKRKDLRKVPHVLLGNLSLIGALVTGIYVPLYLVINVMDQFFHKPLPGEVCVARYSVSLLFLGLQTLTLVAMAIDRHDSVVRPYKRRITVFNVRQIVRGIWSAATLLIVVHLIFAVNGGKNHCYAGMRHKTTTTTYTLAVGNTYLYGTIAVIFTTFVRIVKKLRSSPFAESNQNSEFQVTRFSFMVLFFFIISWIPLSSYVIFNLLTGFTSPDFRGIKALLLSMSNLDYVVNPFIHMNMLRAVQRAAGPAKPENGDPQKERPGTSWIEKQPQISEVQLNSGAIQPTD